MGILLTMDPTLHHKMKVMKPMMDLVKGLDRIMTAIARSKERRRCKAMAKCSAKFRELTDANFGIGDNF